MSQKVQMSYTDHFPEVVHAMSTRGLLLTAWKDETKSQANAMTIGWGMIGEIWSRPIWQVLVRPSRYTHQLIEKEGWFAVNVLGTEYNDALKLCGTVSGRDRDKIAETGLTIVEGDGYGTPVIAESIIHYECHIVHANDFMPEAMVPDIREGSYPSGDYHSVYWGQIMDAQVDESAIATLSA